MKGKSYLRNLLESFVVGTSKIDKGKPRDRMHLDFHMAFNKVSCRLNIVRANDIEYNILAWMNG